MTRILNIGTNKSATENALSDSIEVGRVAYEASHRKVMFRKLGEWPTRRLTVK